MWVIGAWIAAAATVMGREALHRLRRGAPWQPVLAGVTLALLLWGGVTLVRRAAGLDILGDGHTLTLGAQLVKVWDLYAVTFSGMSVVNWVFGTDVLVTSAFNVLLLAQLVTAIVLLAWCRPWSPARRFLAFLTAATLYLVLAIAATRQVGGSHHLFTLWPMPTLHLVALVAVAAQHLGTERGRGMALRASVALTGVIAGARCSHGTWPWTCATSTSGATTATSGRCSTPPSPSLGKRLDTFGADRVMAVDWGLHQPLVTLEGRERAATYREWTWRLIDAKGSVAGSDMQRVIAQDLAGKRVAFVLHGPGYTVFDGVRARLDALLAGTRPCSTEEEGFVNAAGKTIYTIVMADYASCTPRP